MNAQALSKWLGRGDVPEACTDKTPAEVLGWMNSDLRTTLGSLDGAPASIANAVVQLLPFGSRVALEKLDIVRRGSIADDTGHYSIVLTDFGYSVIAAAAIDNEADPKGVADWSARATLAAQALEQT